MVKTLVGVEGMMCPMCESHVCDAIRNKINPKKVNASHKKKQVEIISDEEISEELIKEVINPTGYTVTNVESEEYSKKGLFRK